MFLGLPLIDIGVIVGYFVIVLYIGFRAMKRISSSEDYFLAGRRFGKSIQTFAAFGQGTSAESAVNTTTMVATNGAAGLGLGLINGIYSMPILWMITMWYRRLRYISLAEFFAERYNSKLMAGFYAFAQTLLFMIVAAGAFTAMSKTVAAISEKPLEALTQAEVTERQLALELQTLYQRDYNLLANSEKERLQELKQLNPQINFSYINRTYLTISLAIIVLLYAVSGGLEAAFITDMVQGICILALTLMLIPFAMVRINQEHNTEGILGPFQAFHKNLPESFFQVFGSPNLPQFTWYFILSFGILAILNTAAQANQLTAAGSAKDDETARFGFITGIFIKRYCSVIWGLIAMMTLLLYGNEVTDPDYVWGMATRELLPTGLVGLMIACLMAALMSTADALMLTSSSLLTNSVYKPLFDGKSDKHYILVGRLFCIVYVIGGVTIALALDDVFTLFIFMLGFNAMLAAAFWLGMLWRRANRLAAWLSIATTFIATLALPILVPFIPGIRDNAYLQKQTQAYTVENTYNAKLADVQNRYHEIATWDELNKTGQASGSRPKSIQAGESFIKSGYISAQSIFWQKGISKDQDGNTTGRGMIKVELVALDLLGFNLEKNKHALNESFTAIFRIIFPFSILIVVSLLTRPEPSSRLDFFYGRLRTPVSADPAIDAEEVGLTETNPNRFDHQRLFPNTDWEFRKWNRKDWIGQTYVVIAAIGLAAFLWLIVSTGK